MKVPVHVCISGQSSIVSCDRRAHNALLAERDFGRGFMFRKLRQVRADRDMSAFASRASQQARQLLLALAPDQGAHV